VAESMTLPETLSASDKQDPGIAEAHLRRAEVSSALQRIEGGEPNALPLSRVKAHAERHGVAIDIKDAPDEGSPVRAGRRRARPLREGGAEMGGPSGEPDEGEDAGEPV
jgi:hypothetical protein